jgi:phosphoserine phosphatase RsbU/P
VQCRSIRENCVAKIGRALYTRLNNKLMSHTPQIGAIGQSSLPLEEQVARLQALLEAARVVHSTIELDDVLEKAAQIAVRELEMDGALFTSPEVAYGDVDVAALLDETSQYPRFPLVSRSGKLLCELVVAPPGGRDLSMYERDFLEGLALQTATAVETAQYHERDLQWARVQQDLDAARGIQRSLQPKSMPEIEGYSIASRSSACYEVGGDYFDTVMLPDGTHLFVVADVAGKGLASAIVATSFRAAFRSLASQPLSLVDLVSRVGQQHWEEGTEARRRYVTACFVRLNATNQEIEVVNAGHNPALLLQPDGSVKMIEASGTPLGMLPKMRYSNEILPFEPGSRILLYTDGLTEVFCGDDEFGCDRLTEAFVAESSSKAEGILESLWNTLGLYSNNAPQTDDMTALAICYGGLQEEIRS